MQQHPTQHLISSVLFRATYYRGANQCCSSHKQNNLDNDHLQDRRFDHMQQHTAQHLISSVLFRERALRTTSWWLASHGECYIDVEYAPDAAAADDNDDDAATEAATAGLLDAVGVVAVEAVVQGHIEAARDINVHVYATPAAARGDEKFAKLKTTLIKELPKDEDFTGK
jgi:hypothetical protein